MTDVASPHNPFPSYNPTSTALTKANNGVGSVDELEQRLKPYETKARDEAEAQKVADWLDQVSSEQSHR